MPEEKKIIEELKIKTETYYAVQKIRIQAELRIKAFVRDERLTEERAGALHFWLDESLKKFEGIIKKEVATLLKDVPAWTEFMKDVKGVGPCLAGSLVSGIVDISRFNHVSSLWHYCGMHVVDGEAPRRKRGEKLNWHPFLRMTIYKLTDSFIKQNAEKCLYRRLYDEKKAFYQEKYPEPVTVKQGTREITKYTKGHIHNMAKRYAGKMFLSHLWAKWRALEGLSVSDPWIIAHGDHADIIGPEQGVGS